MPPRVQVPKETILEAAKEMVFRDGPDSITYQSLARELGRSTQTIAWKFGSMGNFLDELAEYILEFFNTEIRSGRNLGDNPMLNLIETEEVFIKIALEQPNLIQFVRQHSTSLSADGGVAFVLNAERSAPTRQKIADFAGISEDDATEFMKETIVFAQGLVAVIISNTNAFTYEMAVDMLKNVAVNRLIRSGVPEKKAKSLV